MLVEKCTICCNANEFTRKLDREDYLLKLRYIAPEVKWCHNYQICGQCVSDLMVACKFKELCLNVQRNEDLYSTRNNDIILNIKDENKISKDGKNCQFQIRPQTFTCHNRDIHFDNKNDLTKHIEQEHKCKQKEECSKCGTKFISSTLLKEHYLICPSGLSQNGSQSRFDKHILTSYRKKKNKQGTLTNIENGFEKNLCNKDLVCKHSLETKYNKEGKFSCEICNETFTTVEKLIEHCGAVHFIYDKSINPYLCDKCNHRFKSYTDLVNHNSHHVKSGTNICSFCNNDSKIQNNQSLNHKENDLLVCVDCHIIFRSKAELQHHLDIIHRAIDDLLLQDDKRNENQKEEIDFEFQKDEQSLISSNDVNVHESLDKESFSTSHLGNKQCKEVMETVEEQSKNHFICEFCESFYTSERNLSLHKLYCGKRGVDFTNNSNGTSMLGTSNRKSRKTMRTFTCEICSEKFDYIKVALEHYVVQHAVDEKAVKLYTCDMCNQRFSTSTNLQKHQKYHDKNRNKICSICGKSFITKSDLLVHEYTHYNRRNYKCIKCNKAFNTNKNFWTHNLVVHTDPAQWKHVCNKCNKRFALKASYDQHLKRHNGEKNFSCHICSKSFISQSEVKRHVDLHSNIKQFKCSYCDKEYKYHKTLKAHISTVHTKATSKVSIRKKNFVCHICPSQFYDKQKLARHLCGHTGVKPFPCQLCERKFSDKSYLKYHLKIAHKVFDHDQ